MFKLLLTVKERLVFGGILPPTGNEVVCQLMEEITDKVKLTPEERDLLKVKFVGDRMKWDDEKEKDKEIEFDKLQMNFLKNQISQLNDRSAIPFEAWSLVKKIKAVEIKEE